MFLLRGISESETRISVDCIYQKSAEELENMDTTGGVIVEEILNFNGEMIMGKRAVLYVNPVTKEQWFEYVDRPLTQEEMLLEQTEKIDLLLQMQMFMQGVI